MFAFMKIATLAALAFGTLASAIPSPVAAPADALIERRATDVTSVLNNLHSSLGAPCGKLSGLTGIEVSVNIDVVVDLVAEIVVLVNGAVSDCHGLPTGSGNLIVILCSILNLIFGACGVVYNLVGVSQVALLTVFAVLDVCVGALISLVLGIVGGILSIVLGLVASLLTCGAVILELHLSLCISLLAL